MTLHHERVTAIKRTREYLCKLLLRPGNGGLRRVPKEVRLAARSLLRHYPNDSEVMVLDDDGNWKMICEKDLSP